ncbi:exodeoxyribonuclease V subunit gamma [Alkalimarinus coralli]|uniref:exodeoxyribonuclease V subunit gamma n=1 Tax=Alkalimarinus coralli TaxID=2935863 RepID=UPI00202B96D8|nr:exodeoxyribonuclease V subunit gamma [Alkalimarinus coralli]
MLNFYPGNRMEDLVTLLSRLLEVPTENPLSEDIILVQNHGMHHWLSLELASRRGIVMNARFPLPGNFFWHLINTILSDDDVPDASPYSREVLIWAIYEVLGADSFFNNDLCKEAKEYWFKASDSSPDQLKRFQLARELADLFEQYLIYRPEWIELWQSSATESQGKTPPKSVASHWQGVLWSELRQRLGEPPLTLIKKALARMPVSQSDIPKRLFIFGINALPPIWMDFIKSMSAFSDIHFFMLNPSDEYWGDLRTEKAIIRERAKWVERGQPLPSIADEIGNPLLANLGQQGQECLKLLCDRVDSEIPLFYSAGRDTLLHKVQDDILTLSDRRDNPEESRIGSAENTDHARSSDNSITVASAHSALREIQALHDWLLMQFELDDSLTPKDVLVMSPQVENYAPYIDSVFKRGRFIDDDADPQLPCSIADRKLSDLEPLIQAFLELLTLPDSRFQVSQILGYLRLPAVQRKFGLDNSDVELFTHWLSVASIHWGLDSQHKASVSGASKSSERFTWKQGLNRLLLGFAQADSEQIYLDDHGEPLLALPWVEGESAEKLGKLMGLIEALQFYSKQLLVERTPLSWQHFLTELVESIFDEEGEDSNGYQILLNAIGSLAEHTTTAGFDETIPLSVVLSYLSNCFSQPQQGQSFMTGQITFCSMIPMRSVPFRVIAVLGLNDGDLPRQRQPMGFDLLAASPPRLGDRSRRGDDRYLFLEALISARDKLYLSYQGSDIKNNQERQPSLLVKELTDYLDSAYGWCSGRQIKQHPLQPFSKRNYIEPFFGFNRRWLSLGIEADTRDNAIELSAAQANSDNPSVEGGSDALNQPIELDIEKLVAFFDHPSKAFGIERLKLFFNQGSQEIPEDTEPFTSNYLDRYIIQSELIASHINGEDSALRLQHEVLRGALPDSPRTEIELDAWKEQADVFSEALINLIDKPIEKKAFSVAIGGYIVTGSCWISGNTMVFWRPADPKGKDLVRMWLYHNVVSLAASGNEFDFIESTKGVFRDQKKEGYKILEFGSVASPVDEVKKWLKCMEEGMNSPKLINAEIANKVFDKTRAGKEFTRQDFEALWCDNFSQRGLVFDPYIDWFWQTMPDWPGRWHEEIVDLYSDLFSSLRGQAQ